MGLGIGRQLNRFKLEPVAGYKLSLLDVVLFPNRLLGVAAPLTLYARWRKALGALISESAFGAAKLENLRDMYPSKHDRQLVVIQSLRQALALSQGGDVVELGCFRGHTAVQLLHTLEVTGASSRLYLFDSFEGLPPSTLEHDRNWRAGELQADFQEVAQRFSRNSRVEIIKGFFDETLSRHSQMRICFAHVDADLYESTKTANTWLLDKVESGGVVVYDDYGFANCIGVKQAVDEDFHDRTDYFQLYLPTGQFVAMRR